jgi:hypothetical protein
MTLPIDKEGIAEDPPKEPEDEETQSPATGGDDEGQEGQEPPTPEPAPEATPAEPEALTPEKARQLAMDPTMRTVLNEEMYRVIQALEGDRAAQANQTRVAKLVEDEDFEALGKEYAEIARRQQQAVEVEKVVHGIRQDFYSTTFAQLVKDMPELATLDDEGRKTLDPSKFDSDAAYLKAIVDYVADKRIETAAPAKAKKILEDFGAAVEAQKAGTANEQAGKQPLLPGASPGASLPGGSFDLLNKAYAKEGDEEE